MSKMKGAKMSDITYIQKLRYSLKHALTAIHYSKSIGKEYPILEGELKEVLATPRMNCEVGTPKEQLDRFNAFCCVQKSCKLCPCNQILDSGEVRCNCFKWGQMPYCREDDNDQK